VLRAKYGLGAFLRALRSDEPEAHTVLMALR